MNALRHSRWAVPLAVALALSACTGEDAPEGGVSGSASASVPAAPARPVLRFNALGGGSPIIMVYPGTTESAADKEHNDTFRHGEEWTVDCKQKGRWVESNTNLGEEHRKLDDWYRLGGLPVRYATAVYVDIVPANAEVPICPPAS